jgi:hypothetical protein
MRFLYLGLLGTTALFTLACGSTIIDGDDDDGSGGSGAGDCGAPPPPGAGGYCPPSYECIDGQWQDTAGACPEPLCPASEPYDDVACVMEGQDCQYPYEFGCDTEPSEITYRCMNGFWSAITPYCSKEPVCPSALPIDGSDCSGWETAWDCYYDVTVECSQDQDVAYAYCNADWVWEVDMPASCEGCNYADPATCEADAACRWLVPGCGENPLLGEGCHPVADCAPDSCGDGGTCSSYDANPCWNQPCDACSAPVSICEMIFFPNE